MANDHILGSVRTPRIIPEEEIDAVFAVLERSVDAADAAELLAMLGLVGPDLRTLRYARAVLARRRAGVGSGPSTPPAPVQAVHGSLSAEDGAS